MKLNKRTAVLLPIVIVGVVIALVTTKYQHKEGFQHDSGLIFGTSYNITYQSDKSLKAEIEAELHAVDASLSPFNEASVITAVNNNRPVELDGHFLNVWKISSEVNKETQGCFDITVAPLVNAWGFGFKNGTQPTKEAIDSLREIVGFSKVKMVKDMIVKQDKRIMLDCSAVAKGYAVDVVAKMLRSKGIQNFMVEIGGEIVTAGINPNRMPWRIGVTKPSDDSLSVNSELQTVLNVTDKAMATSGNYRNYYYKDGKKYAHTIDPKTGYPVQHNILSSTVLADDCAIADAYATAFMVMGLQRAQEVLRKHPELMAYFIYSDESGENKVWFSPSLKDKIAE